MQKSLPSEPPVLFCVHCNNLFSDDEVVKLAFEVTAHTPWEAACFSNVQAAVKGHSYGLQLKGKKGYQKSRVVNLHGWANCRSLWNVRFPLTKHLWSSRVDSENRKSTKVQACSLRSRGNRCYRDQTGGWLGEISQVRKDRWTSTSRRDAGHSMTDDRWSVGAVYSDVDDMCDRKCAAVCNGHLGQENILSMYSWLLYLWECLSSVTAVKRKLWDRVRDVIPETCLNRFALSYGSLAFLFC